MKIFICIVILQSLLFMNVIAQFRIPNVPYGPQINNPAQINNAAQINNQPLVNSLLTTYSSYMPFADKLGAIVSVIRKMPPKSPRSPNDRLYMANALKESALKNIMFAANACTCPKKADNRMPLPNSQGVVNDVIGKRAVNFRYI